MQIGQQERFLTIRAVSVMPLSARFLLVFAVRASDRRVGEGVTGVSRDMCMNGHPAAIRLASHQHLRHRTLAGQLLDLSIAVDANDED